MPKIEVEGLGRFEVDESFINLSPDEQEEEIQSLRQQLSGEQGDDMVTGAQMEDRLGAPQKPVQQPPVDQPGAGLIPGGIYGEQGSEAARTVSTAAGDITAENVGRSVAQGISVGFGDEAEAWVRSKVNGTSYDDEYSQIQDEMQAFKNNHFWLATGLEVAGGLPLPGGAARTGATALGKTMRGMGVGAVYGAGYGSGTAQPGERMQGAAEGAGFGAAGGAAVPLAMALGKAGINAVRGTVRGGKSGIVANVAPEARAGQEIGEAISGDRKLADEIQQISGDVSETRPLSMAEAAGAQARGQPVKLMDMGQPHGAVHEMARTAANRDPRSRQIINTVLDNRYRDQNVRIGEFIQRAFGSRQPTEVLDAIRLKARSTLAPLYRKAYAEGQDLWDPILEQLTKSDAVKKAIRQAERTGSNRAIVDKFDPPHKPFRIDQETGAVSLKEGVLPNLQFWDVVKQNLDDQVSVAYRKGASGEARDISGLRDMLRKHLDTRVSSYAEARSTAAKFFGAEDAYDAGQKFIKYRGDEAAAAKMLKKMSPEERDLFREGFAARFVADLNEIGDSRNILNATFVNSKAARKRIEIAMGVKQSRELEAALRVERIMNLTREASQGNSKTAQFLIGEFSKLSGQGVAAGTAVTGYQLLTGQEVSPMGFLVNVLVGGGLSSSRMLARQKVAEAAARKLISSDTQIADKAITNLSRNKPMMNSLRKFETWLSTMEPRAAKAGAQTAATNLDMEGVGEAMSGAFGS